MRHRWLAIGLSLAMTAMVACGSEILAPTRIPDPGLLAQPVTYDCGGLLFDPALFDGPSEAQAARTPQATILREYIAQTAREGEALPETGWHLLEQRVDGADFLTARQVVGEGTEVLSVTVQLNVSFALRAAWHRCQPRAVMPPGLNIGSWSLDDAVEPHQDTQVLRLLVQEQACASGRSPTGRIVGPAIRIDATSVVILFGITELMQPVTCQGNPAAPVSVDLGESIGDRDLIDPSRWPNVVIDVAP